MEEEEALSNPIPTTTSFQNLDPTNQRKHAAMMERLSLLHQSRLATKPNTPDSSSPSFESTQAFLSLFSNSKLSIESHISLIHQNPNSNLESLKSELEKVSISISELEKLVAENSYFLPSYEVRSCLKSISDIKQTLENATSDLIPKKKFQFKGKRATKNAPVSVENQAQIEKNPNGDSEQIGLKGKENEVLVNEPQIENQNVGSKQMGFRVRDLPGFRGEENEVLVKEFKSGVEDIGEFTVSDLSNCEVKLIGSLRALFVHRLENCRVYVGPVFGSILIEEVEGCVFVLASHQIRIHNAKGSDFYVQVRSRPIIEDSSGVRFAPYCLSYDGIERDLKESNLDEETGNWENVDDFRWLRAVQSPNWSILPESERIAVVRVKKG